VTSRIVPARLRSGETFCVVAGAPAADGEGEGEGRVTGGVRTTVGRGVRGVRVAATGALTEADSCCRAWLAPTTAAPTKIPVAPTAAARCSPKRLIHAAMVMETYAVGRVRNDTGTRETA
jgi:hypothetical protein